MSVTQLLEPNDLNLFCSSISSSTGLIGSTGPIGPTGPSSGATGATGSAGPTGSNGQTGSVGPTGAQGIQGIQGETGSMGQTGSNGLTGSEGPTGQQGIQGLTGDTGSQGIQGIEGPTGSQGLIGPTGIQGVTGDAGGPTGSVGPTGANGSNGIQGSTGPTGANGINGSNGIQGVTGADGATGLAGQTGSQGIQGIEGPTGSQGIQGIQGVAGPTGSVGANGSIGATGSQGIQGVAGPTGSQGLQGIVGQQGQTGATGAIGNFNTSSVLHITNTTAVGAGTGAIISDGGIYAAGGITSNSGQILANGTQESSSISTGSIVTLGGMGSAKNINSGETITGRQLVAKNIGTSSITTAMINSYDTGNNYVQDNIQNLSTGDTASSDFVCTANDGTDSTGYIDMGVNGSGYAQGQMNGQAHDGYLYVLNNTGTGNGDLFLGAGSTAGKVNIFSGGMAAGNLGLQMSGVPQTVYLPWTTETTSYSTGALVSYGGTSLNKSLYLGGSSFYAQMTADFISGGNNVVLGMGTYFRMLNVTANLTITGFTGGVDGRVIHLWGYYPTGGINAYISNDNSGSLATNRIYTQDGGNDAMYFNGVATLSLMYSGILSRWIMINITP
jgi:hypothetical protein